MALLLLPAAAAASTRARARSMSRFSSSHCARRSHEAKSASWATSTTATSPSPRETSSRACTKRRRRGSIPRDLRPAADAPGVLAVLASRVRLRNARAQRLELLGVGRAACRRSSAVRATAPPRPRSSRLIDVEAHAPVAVPALPDLAQREGEERQRILLQRVRRRARRRGPAPCRDRPAPPAGDDLAARAAESGPSGSDSNAMSRKSGSAGSRRGSRSEASPRPPARALRQRPEQAQATSRSAPSARVEQLLGLIHRDQDAGVPRAGGAAQVGGQSSRGARVRGSSASSGDRRSHGVALQRVRGELLAEAREGVVSTPANAPTGSCLGRTGSRTSQRSGSRRSRGSSPARTSDDFPEPEAPSTSRSAHAPNCRSRFRASSPSRMRSSRPKKTPASASWKASRPGKGGRDPSHSKRRRGRGRARRASARARRRLLASRVRSITWRS